ncbi:MAG: proton-conducting transporter membrane subunit [Pseudomonadota bacterium]
MTEHYSVLLIIIPFLSGLLISIVGWYDQKKCYAIAILCLFLSIIISISLLLAVMQNGEAVRYRIGGWAPPWGIAYHVDYLNGIVLVVISMTSFLNLAGARKVIEKEFSDRIGAFYTLYILFTTGLLGMVVTGDAFNLYVLLEITSLTGYALIGFGVNRAPLSALNYLLMGTIGASFYLLGVGYLYMGTGSLNMADIARLLPAIYHSRTVMFAFLLILCGLFVKMALFPLHGWLPNAYSDAPSISSGLIAPLTTKVMVYVMIRMVLTVFTPAFSFSFAALNSTMVWVAVIGILSGSMLALFQTRLKKMITYVIVTEIGYMVGGFWLGTRDGMTGAILHIVNDAMMTLCLFLSITLISYKIKGDRFSDFRGIFRKMPVTMTAFVVAALSIIGVPPTCGFFSKWYLISGGIAAGHYGFIAALLFSSLVNAVLFFRMIEIGYFEPFSDHGANSGHVPEVRMDEAPVSMLVPLMITAAMLIVLGIFSGDIVTRAIQFAIPATII